jgi:AraC-like DNA-binding protein
MNSPRHQSLITPGSAVQLAGMVRVAPAADLADVVEQHWIVAWDHRGRSPVTQEVLPDPCVNLAIEPSGVLVYGVTSGRSAHVLAGAGTVVGTKFRPGGFSGFAPGPVRALNDRRLAPSEVFGSDGHRLEGELARAETTRALIEVVNTFLRGHRPPAVPERALVFEIVSAMRAAAPGTRVSEVASSFAMSPRTLQRLFAEHVGAGPKQVLQRFRHQDATDRLAAHGRADEGGVARLAAELGYFDQAHFIHDFRVATGRLPSTLIGT